MSPVVVRIMVWLRLAATDLQLVSRVPEASVTT
jgi:hypothetical protein